jgi:hypothetical protein
LRSPITPTTVVGWAGGSLVDQHDRRDGCAVGGTDVAARAQRQSQRADEARREEVIPRFRTLVLRKLAPDDPERRVFVIARPREIAAQADGAHARHRPHALSQAIEELSHLRGFAVARRRNVDDRREHVIGTEARVHVQQ